MGSGARLTGFVTNADGTITEVAAAISRPSREAGHPSWYCIVQCPAILSSDKAIYGVDEKQAAELAEMFLREMFDHHGVTILGAC
ncbi:MAG: hypothetical protein GEU92_03250 [Alphaproteobacteria bacterium]|nr:hypothetical protein [Alphaproteobacteria bacterium]